MKRSGFFLGIWLAASALSGTTCAAGEGKDGWPQGTPNLSVTTTEGRSFSLSDQRGKWTIVNYWATWCSPCLKEMPEFQSLVQSRNDMALIGLAYEEISQGEMRDFLKKHAIGYPIAIVDVAEPPGDFPVPRGLPTTWLINPEGYVEQQFIGPVTDGELAQVIEKANARTSSR